MTKHEAEYISNMIKEAEVHNLLVEVVMSYGIACRNNKPLEVEEYAQCCEEALLEWDI